MRSIGRDLRDGVRVFRKNPGFTISVVAILALGIGANTTVFSFANAALWKPLPYPRADRLMTLPAAHAGGDAGTEVAFANFLDWRRETRSFDRLGAWGPASFNVGADGSNPAAGPERIKAAAVSPSGLQALGVGAVVGRLFSADEERPGSLVAILSYGFWQSRYAGARDVASRTIRLGGETYRIVGVMPPEFRFPSSDVRLWVPLRVTEGRAANRQSRWLYVFGRLRDGVSVAASQREMDIVTRSLEALHPRTNTGWGVRVVPLSDYVAGSSRRVLGLLLATVALVLGVACANVANLQLARASTRRREMAIRAAMGASTLDVVRQLLVEGTMIAGAGAALGLLAARAALPALARLAATSLPRVEEAHLDFRVLLFTLVVGAATAVLFGLVAVRAALRADLAESLQGSRGEGGGTSAARGAARFRRMLTSAEVAGALVLTVGAMLLLTSLSRLIAVPAGLNPRHVLSMETVLSSARYPDNQRRAAYFRELIDKASLVPGVESAAGISTLPLSGANATEGYAIEGRAPASPGHTPEAGLRVVTPGYFRTLGIPLLTGRDFTWRDRSGAPGVVIVNRTFAERNWPGVDPLGRRVRLDDGRGEPREVVGVVGDVRHSRLDLPAVPEIYVTADQHPEDVIVLLVRSRLPPSTITLRLLAEAASIDPEQPLFHVASMEEVLSASVSRPRLYASVVGTFAGLALLLAVAGVGSLASYSVAQRRPELAIRAAMGASPRDLRRFVLGDAMALAGAGIVVGIFGSVVASRALRGLLYGVGPDDPRVLAAAAALLGAAALAASIVPALRAGRIDPAAALRADG